MASAAKRRPATDGGGGIAALPEELLQEIFFRVGSVKHLFLIAVTCRRWLRLFTDRAFLRGLLCRGQGEGGHRARLLGFLTSKDPFMHCESMIMARMAQRASVSPPIFLATPESPLGPTSFAAADGGGGTFNYAEPLAARRGFVLMKLVPRAFDLKRMCAAGHHFGLCNPVTGERRVLPLLDCPCGSDCVSGYAIVTAADVKQPPSPSSPARFTFSQLLIARQMNHLLRIHSYTAATRRWGCVPGTYLDVHGFFSMAGEGSAVVHRGAAHWLCSDLNAMTREQQDDQILFKLSVVVSRARVSGSLTKLPIRAGGTPLLCVSKDGKLWIACVYMVHMSIWTQQDGEEDDPTAWLRTRVIRIPMVVPTPNYPPRLKFYMEQWSEFDRGTMLVLYREGGVFVFDLDLEKAVMEKVMDCFPSLARYRLLQRYLPYEMDLVEFFVSHLGGLSSLKRKRQLL